MDLAIWKHEGHTFRAGLKGGPGNAITENVAGIEARRFVPFDSKVSFDIPRNSKGVSSFLHNPNKPIQDVALRNPGFQNVGTVIFNGKVVVNVLFVIVKVGDFGNHFSIDFEKSMHSCDHDSC